VNIVVIVQVNALFETLDLTESVQRKGHISLYNCLVLGHTKYNGVQRVYCNPFPAKPFYGSHSLDLVMIRPPGVDHGAFVVLQIQFGMHGFYSFSLPHHKPTPGPKRLNVHSCQRWKHTTTLNMVIIVIIVLIEQKVLFSSFEPSLKHSEDGHCAMKLTR
jgi:hypothetical protein